MQHLNEQLAAEVADTAAALGIAVTTLGRRLGQGGMFHARLVAGKRVWPETAAAVRKKLHEMLSNTACDNSHDNAATDAAALSSPNPQPREAAE
jgi:hypothetical protein